MKTHVGRLVYNKDENDLVIKKENEEERKGSAVTKTRAKELFEKKKKRTGDNYA